MSEVYFLSLYAQEYLDKEPPMSKPLLYRDLPLHAYFRLPTNSHEFYQRLDFLHCYALPNPALGVNPGLREIRHIDPEVQVIPYTPGETALL